MSYLGKSSGFTLIELMSTTAILAILASLAIPSYRDFVSKAHLAEVLLEYDGIRENSQIIASEQGGDLCNWEVSSNGLANSTDINLIQLYIDDAFSTLDSLHWSSSMSGLADVSPSAKKSALVVQFAGVGEEGVRRSKLLASIFKNNGLFDKWQTNSSSLAAFTVFLENCSNISSTSTSVAGRITHAPANMPVTLPVQPAHKTTSAIVPQTVPSSSVPVPQATSVASQATTPAPKTTPIVPQATTSTPQTTTTTGSPNSNSHQDAVSKPQLVSAAQQKRQCLSNCRAIWPHGNGRKYRTCRASCM